MTPATRCTAAGLVLACTVSLGTAVTSAVSTARADSISEQQKKN